LRNCYPEKSSASYSGISAARDCNTPALALNTVRASLEKCGRNDVETYCAAQFEISPRFRIGDTEPGAFQSTFENTFFQNAV